MITFEQARSTVAADAAVREFFGDGFTVDEFGWQNDDVYLMSVDAADGVALFDTPAILVDKTTGMVIQKTGLLGIPSAPDLQPIGDVPED
ncbi:hypothetical protein [Mycolicibacterium mucogenicum]|uniref:Uncharacterized protein n=1 Tax=Mycolicibacterium mucogenicum DSM 44124 TaxID=1226753 RepID=A0A8H2JGE2_MYCMU|nr:hypothetical protein [Mycolicibacterium mucogenicum]KAB7755222.1 hypothetical protein MMUC44124_20715 [Mycolicibacterium mucogenicum DSM 44124]QPG68891.1 hypothetical protein C1S78_026320 [Mycolicibacterium mucogenicum DSM 44124]